MGTDELFTCQARGLALNMCLASLRLAEEDGHSLTRLVLWKSHPHPRENYFCEGRSRLQTSLLFLLHLPQGALIWFGSPGTCHTACGGSGRRDGEKRSLVSPLRAERWEEAVLQVLGFRAQRLHALSVRLRGQCGYCVGNFGQGALLGRWARGGQSEDLVLDQIPAQGGKGARGDQGCNVGWEHQRALGLCSGARGISCGC